MGTMKRLVLFAVVNLAVMFVISALVAVLGLKPYLEANGLNYGALLVLCGVMGFAGSFFSLAISRWSARMMTGMQLIDPANPGSREAAALVRTVQSLCDEAGLKVLPQIGVYESPEVNAFATGPGRDSALVAVSTGMLERMDARAVKAVLAHEIAHITNGDMVTMTLLQGVINTFVMFLARVGAFLIDQAMRSRSNDREERGGGGLGFFGHMILVMVLESVLMALAMPVVFWFSRWREFRADAGAAKLTNAQDMIHALQSLKARMNMIDDRAPSLATMKIVSHPQGLIARLYASHPPLDDRIEALQRLP